MGETAQIQWFPGHMAKTRRIMQSNLKLVDAVVEITDARIPVSSRNPEMDQLVGTKPRLIVLNKSDTADETITAQWVDYYKRNGIPALPADCRSGKNINRFVPLLQGTMADKLERWKNKGMTGRPIRMMVVGIPNVGKSSFINRLAGTKAAKVADRPGVTRGKQWVSLESNLELLDMPGVLWPKFEDKLVGERLAFTGAVRDDILDTEYLACRLLETLCADKIYRAGVCKRYGIEAADIMDAPEEETFSGCMKGFALLERIGKKRGFMISGGEIHTERTAITVLDEFRAGKLGRITLEKPERE